MNNPSDPPYRGKDLDPPLESLTLPQKERPWTPVPRPPSAHVKGRTGEEDGRPTEKCGRERKGRRRRARERGEGRGMREASQEGYRHGGGWGMDRSRLELEILPLPRTPDLRRQRPTDLFFVLTLINMNTTLKAGSVPVWLSGACRSPGRKEGWAGAGEGGSGGGAVRRPSEPDLRWSVQPDSQVGVPIHTHTVFVP